jgi:hypothetical protein
MLRFVITVTGLFLAGIVLTTYATSALAAHTRLSAQEVQSLADTAATSASYDMGKFNRFGSPRFDVVTRVWDVEFRGWTQTRFRVFVYDATSHTEVTCLGMSPGGLIETADLPLEVQSFVANGERATDLECADLRGDGLPDYLLVTQNREQTKRTVQILLREPQRQIISAVSNSKLVQAPFEDGVNGDHYIVARRNKFKVVNDSAGTGGGIGHSFYFEYSKTENTWLLTRAKKHIWGTQSEGEQNNTWGPKDFGSIKIGEFDRGLFSN